ncbi:MULTISPECIES: helix-turn-helix transcriptional regulator [unclassified Saccharopolyspora]|uniref:helix-turn-helix domain-containing protein n=1 Tax=unclassified Saccharopolyspora TaxID=2646250 RepID=UPI001CD5D44A|nr:MULTISPECIES: helix-turn-helix transcriptional regulator [unclassified Saccharopolyspora]MCA1226159.1 helix-turn-helix transcriptional regulator [Saccharopolyspora sp. 6M]MCA1282768.1 helix-turn-helix transcriptional regulator [Saccharopolyspora sp. 7B]
MIPIQPADGDEPVPDDVPLVPEQATVPDAETVRWDDVEAVRREPDPVRQAARATELINECGRRVTELAALRRSAIERAHHDHGLTYADVADSLGITRGRITQIRNGRTDT